MGRQRPSDEYATASCDGKERLPESVARRVVKRMQARYKIPLMVYRCTVCGGYHIGSKRRREKP